MSFLKPHYARLSLKLFYWQAPAIDRYLSRFRGCLHELLPGYGAVASPSTRFLSLLRPNLPSSNMAPQEAGPTRRLPGFRRREFWFRSNSVLAAFFLLAPPPPLLGRGRSSAELARPAPSGSAVARDPPRDLAALGFPVW